MRPIAASSSHANVFTVGRSSVSLLAPHVYAISNGNRNKGNEH